MYATVNSCPFCNGFKLRVLRTEDNSAYWVQCKCRRCQAEGPTVEIKRHEWNKFAKEKMTMTQIRMRMFTKAINAWNDRSNHSYCATVDLPFSEY